jgi:hypothetical protein
MLSKNGNLSHFPKSVFWRFFGARLCAAFVAAFAFAKPAVAVTYDEAKDSATTIGQWLARSTAHYDFLSASPVGPRRAGSKFFTKSAPLQMASDYGVSYLKAPTTNSVLDAFILLGVPTTSMPGAMTITRYHVAWSFANEHDFSASILSSKDATGWGIGYKWLYDKDEFIHYSYRIGYSYSQKTNFFQAANITNEVLTSLYFRVIDLYAGIRHSLGWAEFPSSVPELQLPRAEFVANLGQLEYFAGIIAASTTNSRLTLQVNFAESQTWLAGKFSFHFDELYPTFNNWFEDPRALKQ